MFEGGRSFGAPKRELLFVFTLSCRGAQPQVETRVALADTLTNLRNYSEAARVRFPFCCCRCCCLTQETMSTEPYRV